jgi:hypothetical protein
MPRTLPAKQYIPAQKRTHLWDKKNMRTKLQHFYTHSAHTHKKKALNTKQVENPGQAKGTAQQH